MPHARKRIVTTTILKKLKFFPVLGIQGARQTGKSFLAKKLLDAHLKHCKYVSFDDENQSSFAKNTPKAFLENYDSRKPLIIDEAQKVPKIFDAVKFNVDKNRIPGKFILLGSTEFSLLNQIRESLTGRMGKIRIYPLNLRETLDRISNTHFNPTLKDVLVYLQNGGMPGFFFIHNEESQKELIQDWLNLICYRDLQQFRNFKSDPELALRILSLLCTLEEPNIQELTKKIKVDKRKIIKHVKALEELFVIQKINAHPSSYRKKAIYLILDCGIAHYLGANLDRRLHIALMNERLIQRTVSGAKPTAFYHYRSSGGGFIHWIEEAGEKDMDAYLILNQEELKSQHLRIAEAFIDKNKLHRFKVFAPIDEKIKYLGFDVFPWSKMFF